MNATTIGKHHWAKDFAGSGGPPGHGVQVSALACSKVIHDGRSERRMARATTLVCGRFPIWVRLRDDVDEAARARLEKVMLGVSWFGRAGSKFAEKVAGQWHPESSHEHLPEQWYAD